MTIEGGEGAGKSLLAEAIARRFAELSIPLVRTREPGGTALADGIRQLFLDPPQGEKPLPLTELFLVSAARAQHLAKKIEPALADGQWVLCDRFYDSTRAYQGGLGGLDAALVEQLIQHSVSRHPDLTLLLDCPVPVSMQRIQQREATRPATAKLNRYDGGSEALHQQLRESFHKIAARFPQRIVVIDASASADQVFQQAWQAIQQKFFISSERA